MARLSDEEIEQRLAGMDGWERDGDAIRKTFEGEDFMSSVGLVDRLAPVAEEMNHHPDLEISWNKVTVEPVHALRGRAHGERLRARGKHRRPCLVPCYPRPLADERRRAPSK